MLDAPIHPLTSLPLNSLGFAKPPAQTRVVVAMSGGVDSSVVAAELAAEGYDVVGVTLQLYDHGGQGFVYQLQELAFEFGVRKHTVRDRHCRRQSLPGR